MYNVYLGTYGENKTVCSFGTGKKIITNEMTKTSTGDDISGLYMLFYKYPSAKNALTKSITYTVGNKTENIGWRYGSNLSPHTYPAQVPRGKQRDPYRPER
jgi:hypothetical protein